MSRRAQATIEEIFDDDTELPLPSRPLPNTGDRGALLQAINSDESDDDAVDDFGAGNLTRGAGPANTSQRGFGGQNSGHTEQPTVSDLTPYKNWSCIYPIYLDAKRPYGRGSRRIARTNALWWPLSKDIADAANRLGFSVLHEVHKCHPRDWENPGRVRIQLKKDGYLVNPNVKTKKQLLEKVAAFIQGVKPENVPKPPFSVTTTINVQESGTPPAPSAKTPSSTQKGKQPVSSTKAKVKGKSGGDKHIHSNETSVQRLPQPPEPHPALASRISPYSPALPSGVLIDTIKAGMSAASADAAAGGPGAIGGKGKRKVIRVRG